MVLEKGDMWSAFGQGHFMITTNPIQRKDGAVVMGRGIAKEAKERYPQLPYDFGKALANIPIGLIGIYDGFPIWWFMVKNHWKDKARLDLIEDAVNTIKIWHFNGRVDLNFPGIGNGGLSREEVLPIISQLPNNFHVWEKA